MFKKAFRKFVCKMVFHIRELQNFFLQNSLTLSVLWSSLTEIDFGDNINHFSHFINELIKTQLIESHSHWYTARWKQKNVTTFNDYKEFGI